MIGSADPAGYVWAGRTECCWHSEQADLVDRILHPPVIHAPAPDYVEVQPIHNPDADLSLCDQNVGTAWWSDHCTAAGQGENLDVTQPSQWQPSQWQRENVRIIPDGQTDPGFGGRYYDACDGVKESGETASGGRCYH